MGEGDVDDAAPGELGDVGVDLVERPAEVEAALDAVHEGDLAFVGDAVEVGSASNHLMRLAVGVDSGQVRLDPVDLVEQGGEVAARGRPGRLVEVEGGKRSAEDREDRADVARGQLVEADPPAV